MEFRCNADFFLHRQNSRKTVRQIPGALGAHIHSLIQITFWKIFSIELLLYFHKKTVIEKGRPYLKRA